MHTTSKGIAAVVLWLAAVLFMAFVVVGQPAHAGDPGSEGIGSGSANIQVVEGKVELTPFERGEGTAWRAGTVGGVAMGCDTANQMDYVTRHGFDSRFKQFFVESRCFGDGAMIIQVLLKKRVKTYAENKVGLEGPVSVWEIMDLNGIVFYTIASDLRGPYADEVPQTMSL